MIHSEGVFQGFGGLDLFYQAWKPETPPRAAVVIVHGFGEHSSRYGNLVAGLVPRGYALYSFDLRGHGRSAGQRGHIKSWAEYREDTASFIRFAKARELGVPAFICGHGLGALIVEDFVLHYPEGLRGCIVSASPLEPTGVAPALVQTAKILSRVWPTFSLTMGLETAALSRLPEVAKAYTSDPLVHGKATPRFGTETHAATVWVKAHLADWKVPVLVIHGDSDRIAAVEGSQFFFQALPIADKELRLYPGGYHESHNDLDRERVINDIDGWLKRHL